MKKKVLQEILKHWWNRQEAYGPESSFRWTCYLNSDDEIMPAEYGRRRDLEEKQLKAKNQQDKRATQAKGKKRKREDDDSLNAVSLPDGNKPQTEPLVGHPGGPAHMTSDASRSTIPAPPSVIVDFETMEKLLHIGTPRSDPCGVSREGHPCYLVPQANLEFLMKINNDHGQTGVHQTEVPMGDVVLSHPGQDILSTRNHINTALRPIIPPRTVSLPIYPTTSTAGPSNSNVLGPTSDSTARTIPTPPGLSVFELSDPNIGSCPPTASWPTPRRINPNSVDIPPAILIPSGGKEFNPTINNITDISTEATLTKERRAISPTAPAAIVQTEGSSNTLTIDINSPPNPTSELRNDSETHNIDGSVVPRKRRKKNTSNANTVPRRSARTSQQQEQPSSKPAIIKKKK
ncbi:hypothetical protein H0H81_006364 [Sphagnurus paluster]|uniref:Uncharacterized protein n=1 Tax=Sphagnurus paluster TaxID=117069 RepID=A0A9P7KG10_9AGAR|nr:hypothetical protein H0H81_006364 [Sphagnurus paluster]